VNGIVININPVIFQIGNFELRWYSIAILAAVLAGIAVATKQAERKGLSRDIIYSLAPWLLIAGIIGARLFHVIDQWDYYSTHLADIIQIQKGGLAIWGAMAGGSIAAIIYTKLTHISLRKLLDIFVPALFVAQIIGRIGCIINGDAYGSAANLPWSFIYTNPNALIPHYLLGLPTHPYPVYEMLWNGLGLTLVLKFGSSLKKDGYRFLSYLGFYSIGRLLFTFVRQENTLFYGLQQAQVLAIAIMLIIVSVGLYELVLFRHKVIRKTG